MGVSDTTKFADDLMRLLSRNFCLKDGTLRMPKVFNQILATDAAFEISTCVLSKELVISRQDDIVGHRFLFYAADRSKDKEMFGVRN